MRWRPIETAPKNEVVLVYTPPQPGDWPEQVRIEFDHICPDYEDWYYHCEAREHYLAIGGSSAGGPDMVCTGPEEKAPYTHWMPLPPIPSEQEEIVITPALQASFDNLARPNGYQRYLDKYNAESDRHE